MLCLNIVGHENAIAAFQKGARNGRRWGLLATKNLESLLKKTTAG
jgi:hypothetical protein